MRPGREDRHLEPRQSAYNELQRAGHGRVGDNRRALPAATVAMQDAIEVEAENRLHWPILRARGFLQPHWRACSTRDCAMSIACSGVKPIQFRFFGNCITTFPAWWAIPTAM